MRAIVNRAEGPVASLGTIHNPDHESPARHKSTPPPASSKAEGGRVEAEQGRIAYLQPNLHRNRLTVVEKPRQRTGRRINTVTLDLGDDTKATVGVFLLETRRTTAGVRMDRRRRGYFVRSLDQIPGWWNSMERNASRGIVSAPLNLLNPLGRIDRARISSSMAPPIYRT